IARTDRGGEPWVTGSACRFKVASTFAGNVNRDYGFRVSSKSAYPMMVEDSLMKQILVEYLRCDPLTDHETEALIRGGGPVIDLPEEVHVSFTSVDPGYLTVRLAKVGSGLYEGTTHFWSDGSWPASVRIQPDDQPQFTIPANTIEVRDS